MAEWQALCEGYQVDAPRVPHRDGYKKGESERASERGVGGSRVHVCVCLVWLSNLRATLWRIERANRYDHSIIPPEPPNIHTHTQTTPWFA